MACRQGHSRYIAQAFYLIAADILHKTPEQDRPKNQRQQCHECHEHKHQTDCHGADESDDCLEAPSDHATADRRQQGLASLIAAAGLPLANARILSAALLLIVIGTITFTLAND